MEDSETWGAIPTSIARATWRLGFVHPCVLPVALYVYAWTRVCYGQIPRSSAMWPVVLSRSECSCVKKRISHVNICPDKHRFSRTCAAPKGAFLLIYFIVTVVFVCRISRTSISRSPTLEDLLWFSSVPTGICLDYDTIALFCILILTRQTTDQLIWNHKINHKLTMRILPT